MMMMMMMMMMTEAAFCSAEGAVLFWRCTFVIPRL